MWNADNLFFSPSLSRLLFFDRKGSFDTLNQLFVLFPDRFTVFIEIFAGFPGKRY